MDRIEIELGMWESAPCPIYTADVDVEKAEKLLYNSMRNNFGYTEEEIKTFLECGKDEWSREYERFHETLCAEEEAIVIDCGGKYYEDMTDEEYERIAG